MSERYCYSTNEEEYDGDAATREEALAEAINAAEELVDDEGFTVTEVWTARIAPLPVRGMLKYATEMFIDNLRDGAYEEVGEHADGWLQDVSDEHENKLRDAFAEAFEKWMKETGHEPKCYSAEQTQRHEVVVHPMCTNCATRDHAEDDACSKDEDDES